MKGAPADVLERLVALGALDVEAIGSEVAAVMPDAVAVERVVDVLETSQLRVSPALGRDDGSVWVLRPRPVRSGRLLFVPAAPDAPANALQLVDSAAFGTGLHPTTGLCLDLIQQVIEDLSPTSMLDVGVGNGILALAAIACGVERVTGVDIDAGALDAAQRNLALNGVSDRATLHRGGPEAATGTWPFIVANVLAAPLVDMAPVLVQRLAHRGRLLLSGIPESMSDEVIRVYRRLGLRHVDTQVRGGWSVVMLDATW